MASTRLSRMAALATALLFLATPLATAIGMGDFDALDAAPTLLDSPLVADGDLILDGDVRAIGDLIVEATGDILVRGRLAAGHGAPGMPGGDVVLRAGRALVIAPEAVIEAGAGGHGLPADAPGRIARAMDGGQGGDVVLVGLSVQNAGDVAPGMGGRGGDAFGHVALGGDGASPGAFLVNGVPAESFRLAANPTEQVQIYTCPPTDVQTPQLVMGAPGGNACADGTAGVPGIHGQDGQDDETTIDKGSRPDCASFVAGWQDLDGEQGENGYPGIPGGPALASGGKGGDAVSSGMQAGNGGSAIAHGGNGGNGGWGGMGGHAKGAGDGCRGGNGGNGGNGGPATATGGAQGINPLNCAKNGAPGAANAYGGAGGSGGYGGAGGGTNWPYNGGGSGTSGYAGSAGYQYQSSPPALPCLAPDAPTLAAADDLLTCNAVRLTITAPAFAGNSAITHYKVYRGTGPSFLNYVGDVIYGAVLTLALDSPLTQNTTYYYRVKAVTPVGESAYSNLASATVTCLTAVPIGGNLGNVLDPETTPPLLAAVAGSGGTATLTITSPTSILGTPQHYNIYRGPASGSESLIGTVPYGGATTTWNDAGLLPLTTYWYYVTLTTSSTTSSDSNHVAIITPLLLAGGSGNGNAQHTVAKPGSVGTTRTCSAVPVAVKFTFADGSFVLDASYGEGTGVARTDDKAFCAETDAQSKTYGNEGRSAAMDRQTGASQECDEDQAQWMDGAWVVTRTCSSKEQSTLHRVILRESKTRGAWSYSEDVVVRYADGSTSQWGIRAELRGDAGQCTPARAADACL